jgi:type VI secretion system protein ImpI
VRIGRNPLNDLQLEYNFASQFHAVLEHQNGKLILRDLGSTNGTLLKSGRVPPNQSVDLAEHGFEFAIVNLIFRTYSASAQPPQSVPRRPLAATSMFQESTAAMIRESLSNASLAPKLKALEPAMEYARAGMRGLVEQVERILGEVPPANHELFLRQVVGQLPQLAHSPEFRALLSKYRIALNTGTSMSSQEFALQAVCEMASHYLPSRGAPSDPDALARFMTKLNETLDVFLKCFVPLKDGHRQFEADLALGGRQRGPDDPRIAVETARDTQELAMRLLDWRDPSFEAAQAVESVFADIMIHQVAMLNGVMMGVKSLLDELSPAEIERSADDPRHKAGLLQNHHKVLWKLFTQRHGDLADDQKRVFSVLFGKEFGQAYRALSGSEQRAKPTTSSSSSPYLPAQAPSQSVFPVAPAFQNPTQPGPAKGNGPR